jgi:hypothetical protein
MAIGQPRTVAVYDDHANHLKVLRDFMCSERYEYLPDEVQDMFSNRPSPRAVRRPERRADPSRRGLAIAAMLPRRPRRSRPTTWSRHGR